MISDLNFYHYETLPVMHRFEQGEVGGRTQVFQHGDQVLVLDFKLQMFL